MQLALYRYGVVPLEPGGQVGVRPGQIHREGLPRTTRITDSNSSEVTGGRTEKWNCPQPKYNAVGCRGGETGEKNTSKLPKTQRHLCMLYTLIMHMDFPSQDMKSTDKTEEIDQRVESCLLWKTLFQLWEITSSQPNDRIYKRQCQNLQQRNYSM